MIRNKKKLLVSSTWNFVSSDIVKEVEHIMKVENIVSQHELKIGSIIKMLYMDPSR